MKTMQWCLLWLLVSVLSSQAGEEVIQVQKILSNPSAFHRHSVMLKGELTLISQWQGVDLFSPICGPMFTLDDGTGEMLVMYIIRCDQTEVNKATAFAGGQVVVLGTIDAETVVKASSETEYRIRVVATKIRREN